MQWLPERALQPQSLYLGVSAKAKGSSAGHTSGFQGLQLWKGPGDLTGKGAAAGSLLLCLGPSSVHQFFLEATCELAGSRDNPVWGRRGLCDDLSVTTQ